MLCALCACSAGERDGEQAFALQRIGIEPNGEWAVIDELDLHHRAERSCFHVAQIARNEACEVLVKAICFIGCACIGKRRTVAALAVRVERELAHYEHFAVHIRKT